jgi:hypothetical protein
MTKKEGTAMAVPVVSTRDEERVEAAYQRGRADGYEARLDVLAAGVRQLANILDYENCSFAGGNECEGCRAELLEASRIISRIISRLLPVATTATAEAVASSLEVGVEGVGHLDT